MLQLLTSLCIKFQCVPTKVTSSLRLRMVKLYYHDNVDSDQRLPHEGDPVPVSALEELGIYIANIPDRAEVDRIANGKRL